ncbi:hypothetical protein IHQ68_12290 [Chelatococcus sambhunathii]|uniref:Mitochondrial inner membrane protein n=1 Tax=Chelatococcus sambhunathii TaxID=363953 RepID=A0ABU1DH04_9HYPH|nr:hypothetical protein [Chelatococcus sambhunathii]MDR4307396.1 hypothetical protein [Chelatococcus sambhunathii]
MADPKGPETGQDAKGAPSARPRSPTLDLSATDVTPKASKATEGKPADGKPDAEKAPEQAKPASPASSAAPSSAGEAAAGPGAAKSEPAKSEPAKPESPKAGSAKPEPPRSEPAKPQPDKPEAPKPGSSYSPSSGPGSSADARARATARPPVQPDRPAREGVGVLGLIFAALGGAAFALIGVALFGKELIGVAQPDASRVQAVEAKLNAVGGDVAALRSDVSKLKPADTSPIETKLSDLSKSSEATGGRVAGLEDSLKALTEQVAKEPPQDPAIPVLSGRIDGLELRFQNTPSPQELAVLGGRMAGFEARLKELPGKDQLADLTVRIEDLGQTVDGIGQKISAAVAPVSARVDQLATALKERPKGDPVARLVVALGALDQALAEGRPFAPELDAVKSANGETSDLAALDPHAAKGLPTREALGAELAADIAKLAPVKQEPSGSVFDRFVASAGSVVKVTPKDAAGGTDPAALRARVAALGSAGDLEGALAARGSLDEQARAATEDWAQRASARVSAEKAIGSARTAALARLTSND